jgi:hypothetical protein
MFKFKACNFLAIIQVELKRKSLLFLLFVFTKEQTAEIF